MQPYPLSPGFKVSGTSEDAARSMRPRTKHLRELALQMIARHAGGLTADEVAEALGESILTVRPRISELKELGQIREKKDERRKNASGRKASVWVAVG